MSIDSSREFTPEWVRYERAAVLAMAARLTRDASIPEAVLGNAAGIHAWLEAAETRDDRRDRLEALHRADTNRGARRAPDDDPDRLISEAEVYYAFLKAA